MKQIMGRVRLGTQICKFDMLPSALITVLSKNMTITIYVYNFKNSFRFIRKF